MNLKLIFKDQWISFRSPIYRPEELISIFFFRSPTLVSTLLREDVNAIVYRLVGPQVRSTCRIPSKKTERSRQNTENILVDSHDSRYKEYMAFR